MTLCNMAIEMGAKAGLVAPDETTFNYVKGRLHAPKGKDFDDAVAYWKPCKPTKAQLSIPLSLCKQKKFHRRSPGAPIQAR